jgi:hypothetical protein
VLNVNQLHRDRARVHRHSPDWIASFPPKPSGMWRTYGRLWRRHLETEARLDEALVGEPDF